MLLDRLTRPDATRYQVRMCHRTLTFQRYVHQQETREKGKEGERVRLEQYSAKLSLLCSKWCVAVKVKVSRHHTLTHIIHDDSISDVKGFLVQRKRELNDSQVAFCVFEEHILKSTPCSQGSAGPHDAWYQMWPPIAACLPLFLFSSSLLSLSLSSHFSLTWTVWGMNEMWVSERVRLAAWKPVEGQSWRGEHDVQPFFQNLEDTVRGERATHSNSKSKGFSFFPHIFSLWSGFHCGASIILSGTLFSSSSSSSSSSSFSRHQPRFSTCCTADKIVIHREQYIKKNNKYSLSALRPPPLCSTHSRMIREQRWDSQLHYYSLRIILTLHLCTHIRSSPFLL